MIVDKGRKWAKERTDFVTSMEESACQSRFLRTHTHTYTHTRRETKGQMHCRNNRTHTHTHNEKHEALLADARAFPCSVPSQIDFNDHNLHKACAAIALQPTIWTIVRAAPKLEGKSPILFLFQSLPLCCPRSLVRHRQLNPSPTFNRSAAMSTTTAPSPT